VLFRSVRVAMADDLMGAIAALAGWSAVPQVGPGGTGSGAPAGLPRAALELLDRAEERLRAGDWGAFGEALRELRALLEAGAPGGDSPGR